MPRVPRAGRTPVHAAGAPVAVAGYGRATATAATVAAAACLWSALRLGWHRHGGTFIPAEHLEIDLDLAF